MKIKALPTCHVRGGSFISFGYYSLCVAVLLLFTSTTHAAKVNDANRILNFYDLGGIPFENSHNVCAFNTQLLNNTLQYNTSQNTLLFPQNYTFHLHNGVYAKNIHDAIIQIDGVLRFERAHIPSKDGKTNNDSDDNNLNYSDSSVENTNSNGKHDDTGMLHRHHIIPRHKYPHPFPSNIMLDWARNVTITTSESSKAIKHRGVIDGRGSQWWGVPIIGYLQVAEHRPRLLQFNNSQDILIENIILQDSPYHSLYLQAVNRVTVRHISVVARRTKNEGHSWVDISAFNTDGIDVSGHNVHIHDVDIWVQDDCIAVKDSSQWTSSNMTFENINASGMGFVVGSIIGSHVHNITFRNSYLHQTIKGIYMKFAEPSQWHYDRNLTGRVENILYENITMEQPLQWPIWIGPAQQADNRNPCHANPCSLCWPASPTAVCRVVRESKFSNITLRNIVINNPHYSAGVIMGSESDKIENLTWDNVQVTKGMPVPMARYPLHETFPGLKQPIHDHFVPKVVDNVVDLHIGRFAAFIRFNERQLRIFESIVPLYIWLAFLALLALFVAKSSAFEFVEAGLEDEDELQEPLLDKENKKIKIVRSGVFQGLELETESSSFRSSVGDALPANNMDFEPESCNLLSEDFSPDNNDINTPEVLSFPQRDRVFSTDSTAKLKKNFILPPKRHARRYILTFLASFALGVLLLDDTVMWPWRKPSWERYNHYYVCSNVENGLVLGKTWPVPSCFSRPKSSWSIWKWG